MYIVYDILSFIGTILILTKNVMYQKTIMRKGFFLIITVKRGKIGPWCIICFCISLLGSRIINFLSLRLFKEFSRTVDHIVECRFLFYIFHVMCVAFNCSTSWRWRLLIHVGLSIIQNWFDFQLPFAKVRKLSYTKKCVICM